MKVSLSLINPKWKRNGNLAYIGDLDEKKALDLINLKKCKIFLEKVL